MNTLSLKKEAESWESFWYEQKKKRPTEEESPLKTWEKKRPRSGFMRGGKKVQLWGKQDQGIRPGRRQRERLAKLRGSQREVKNGTGESTWVWECPQ